MESVNSSYIMKLWILFDILKMFICATCKFNLHLVIIKGDEIFAFMTFTEHMNVFNYSNENQEWMCISRFTDADTCLFNILVDKFNNEWHLVKLFFSFWNVYGSLYGVLLKIQCSLLRNCKRSLSFTIYDGCLLIWLFSNYY